MFSIGWLPFGLALDARGALPREIAVLPNRRLAESDAEPVPMGKYQFNQCINQIQSAFGGNNGRPDWPATRQKFPPRLALARIR
jgi:hypothetical protein